MAAHPSILAWRIPLDRGAWQGAVHGVAKSQTCLSDRAHMLVAAELGLEPTGCTQSPAVQGAPVSGPGSADWLMSGLLGLPWKHQSQAKIPPRPTNPRGEEREGPGTRGAVGPQETR